MQNLVYMPDLLRMFNIYNKNHEQNDVVLCNASNSPRDAAFLPRNKSVPRFNISIVRNSFFL